MLLTIADDLTKPQSNASRVSKSQGEDAPAEEDTAASKHGEVRFSSQFSVCQLAAEFRALRATVLRLWAEAGPGDAHAACECVRR